MSTGVGYTFSQTPIHTGDTFTLDIRAENITDLAGWQFDIAFDPAILEAINVSEGDFLKTDGEPPFFTVAALITQRVKLGDSMRRGCPLKV